MKILGDNILVTQINPNINQGGISTFIPNESPVIFCKITMINEETCEKLHIDYNRYTDYILVIHSFARKVFLFDTLIINVDDIKVILKEDELSGFLSDK